MTKRIDIIGQNGNDGSHYEQLELPLEDTTAIDEHTEELTQRLIDELHRLKSDLSNEGC